jgi:hypothetical protein
MSEQPRAHRRLTHKPARWAAAITIVVAVGVAIGWYVSRPQRVEIPLEASVAPAGPAQATGVPIRMALASVLTGDSVVDGPLLRAADTLRVRLGAQRDLSLIPIPRGERCGAATPVQLCLELTATRTPNGATLLLSLLHQRTHTVITDVRAAADAPDELRMMGSRVALWSVPGALALLDASDGRGLAVYRDAVRAFTTCDPVALETSRVALRALTTDTPSSSATDALLVLMDALDAQARRDGPALAAARARAQDLRASAAQPDAAQPAVLAALAVTQPPNAAGASDAAMRARQRSPGVADAADAARMCLAAVLQVPQGYPPPTAHRSRSPLRGVPRLYRVSDIPALDEFMQFGAQGFTALHHLRPASHALGFGHVVEVTAVGDFPARQ